MCIHHSCFERRNPHGSSPVRRNMPLGILGAVSTVTIIYVSAATRVSSRIVPTTPASPSNPHSHPLHVFVHVPAARPPWGHHACLPGLALA